MSSIHTVTKDTFPPLLKEIPDPPQKLYIRGTYPYGDLKYLAIVGSRNNSTYGKEVLQTLIKGISGFPIVIISGLALGTDAYAHTLALHHGLNTVAVPGSGISNEALYPRTNYALALKIEKRGGCLISEFEPHARATPESFPRRNRIMAGLSHAVLVIEAASRSGTLITARFALEYNRDVLAVPGSVFSKNSEGSHYLIKNGAIPITSSKDILQALGLTNTHNTLITLSSEEKQLLTLLSTPLSKDALIHKLDMPSHKAHTILMSLTVKGVIREHLGKIHVLYVDRT